MIELSRTVRFCLNEPVSDSAGLSQQPTEQAQSQIAIVVPQPPTCSPNGHSANPPMRGLGRYYQMRVCCTGQPDAVTGYLINIKRIDQAVAQTVLPYLERLIGAQQPTSTIPMGRLMRSMIQLLKDALEGTVVELCLDLTPYYALIIRSDTMSSVIIRQQYEFAAAHRLHTPELSDVENRKLFGKCNNPSGHGHNYRISVSVRTDVQPDGHVTPVEELDALINETVIEPFDHQHLNLDVPQFANLNPTVENITVTIYEMIHNAIHRLGMELDEVSVWETDRTVCTYRGA